MSKQIEQVGRLLGRVLQLEQAVKDDDAEAVLYLIDDLQKKDIAWLLVRTFHRPRSGRPPGRDPRDRAYHKRKIKLRYRQLHDQWCKEHGRERCPLAERRKLAQQAIAEFYAKHSELNGSFPPFTVDEFLRKAKKTDLSSK
jgi:hypothetical protein